VANRNLYAEGKTVDVSAIAVGDMNLSGDSIRGKLVSGGGAEVTGLEITASISSINGPISTTGDASQAKIGSFAGVAAPAAQKTAEEAAKTVGETKTSFAQYEEEASKGTGNRGPMLAKATGRVTVILPNQ
jgi:hypothetical protein